MSLRPNIEARVRHVEDQASEAAKKADAVCEAIDDSIDGEDGCIPEEAFDDPSVVRHTIDLARTGRRIRRESEESGLIRKAR